MHHLKQFLKGDQNVPTFGLIFECDDLKGSNTFMHRLIEGLMNMHYSILQEHKHKGLKDNNKLTFMCYNNIDIKVTKTTFAKCAHIMTQQPSKTSKLFMNSTHLKCYKTLRFVKEKILLINVHNFGEEN